MAFGFQRWNPAGMSLTYRPQTLNFGQNTLGNPMDVLPGDADLRPTNPTIYDPRVVPPDTGNGRTVPTLYPKAYAPTYGDLFQPYEPGKVPTINPNDNTAIALDKLLTGMGMFRDSRGLLPGLKEGGLGALAKGAGAGTGKQKKFNEAAIAGILNLGALPAKPNAGKGVLSPGDFPTEGKPKGKGKNK